MNEDRRTHKHYTLLLVITLTNLTLCLLCPKAVIAVEGTPSHSCSASELQQVNLDCVLPNWQRAVCRWCKDNSYNAKCVDWDVKYKKGRKGEWETCRNLEACTCRIMPGDIRHVMTFNVSSLSSFGQTQEIFEVDFTDRSLIVPDPVNRLKVINNGNSRSMSVTFEEPYHLESVSLVFNITMKSKFDTKILIANRSSIMSSSRHYSVEFNDLIPFTDYKASVKVRPEEGTYWSDTATTSGRTLSDVPARNPETRPSSFQYHLHPGDWRTLIVYYKDIPERYTQGVIGGMRATFKDSKTNQTYVRECSFKDRKCELNKARLTSNFSVEITGSTDVGFGPRIPTSVMTIPEYNEGSSKVPEHLVGEIQYIRDKKAVVLFEWSYDGETQDAFVLYYRRMLHDVAQGGISWFVLNGTQNRAEVVIENGGSTGLQNYQFAVAAEKPGQSAGMSKPFLQCLYQKDGEKPVIQKLTFKPESQDPKSLKVILQPQECKPGHKQIMDMIITVLEVTTAGEIKQGGLNKTEKVPAPRVPLKYHVADLKESAFYNISLTAVCRDGSKCQHLSGVKLETKPPKPYEFPDWAYVVILVIVALVLLLGIGTYWFYRRTTSKKKQLRIQRTPAIILQHLEENSAPDEYYDTTIDDMPRCERSGSESSGSDGDYRTMELNQLILNGKPGGWSGSSNNLGDVSNQLAEADSDGIAGRSQRHLNPTFQLPSLQPVPEADEDNLNYLNGVVYLDRTDEHRHYIANYQKQWPSSQTAPDYFLPNLEAHDAEVLHPKTYAKNKCDCSRDEEGGTSTSGESDDDEYAKVTTRQPCLDVGRSETKSIWHPSSNNAEDLDDDGHSKPRASPEQSASDHERKFVSPSKFDFQDHDLGSLTPEESRAVFPWFDPGEHDSEDDSTISSAAWSDSASHSEGEFRHSVLQGMPSDGGYISRPDQRQDPTSFLQNTFQIRVQ